MRTAGQRIIQTGQVRDQYSQSVLCGISKEDDNEKDKFNRYGYINESVESQ